MSNNLSVLFCQECLGKQVNSQNTVKDTLDTVIPKAIAANGSMAAGFLLMGLESVVCPSCLSTVKRLETQFMG